MAYKGYLVKVGNYVIQPKYIKANTYNAVVHVLDVDSYTDGNGETHRNTLDAVKPVVTFEVPAPITETEVRELMNGIQSNYTIAKERCALVDAFYPELGENKTIKMYMSDIEYTIDTAEFSAGGEIIYSSFSLKFTAYGGNFL